MIQDARMVACVSSMMMLSMSDWFMPSERRRPTYQMAPFMFESIVRRSW
jgi:hypothetical protein